MIQGGEREDGCQHKRWRLAKSRSCVCSVATYFMQGGATYSMELVATYLNEGVATCISHSVATYVVNSVTTDLMKGVAQHASNEACLEVAIVVKKQRVLKQEC